MLHPVQAPSPSSAVLDRALAADIPAIEALLAPEVLRGTVLPRRVRCADFLVLRSVDQPAVLLGCAALTRWSSTVVELGSVVARHKGVGAGRVLVQGALELAFDQGYQHVVVLTGDDAFFGRMGFVAQSDVPWVRARQKRGWGHVTPLHAGRSMESAIDFKANQCAQCPRLAGCRQKFMVRDVHALAGAGGLW